MLASVDLVALTCAALLGYVLWAAPILHQPAALYGKACILLTFFPLIYGAMGLYRSFGPGPVETIRRLTYASSLGFLLLTAASFSLKLEPVYSRAVFVCAWLGSLILLPLARCAALTLLNRFDWWGEPTLIIGSRESIATAVRRFVTAKSVGFRIVGAFYPGALRLSRFGKLRLNSAAPEKIFGYCASGASTVLVCPGTRDATIQALQRCFTRVITLTPEDTLPVEHVNLVNFGANIGIAYTNQLLLRHNRVLKRIIDMVCGSLLLIAAAPIVLLAGLLVRAVSPGPALFCQKREGEDGRTITLFKIRTMYRNAEEVLDNYLAANGELRLEWNSKFKLVSDPRIVGSIGRFIRRFSIDELPQLWNVVRGDMSLVGPRPFPDYHVKAFSAEFRELRNSVRPGLSGMWQVTSRSDGNTDDQQFYDSYYIKNWSLWLDAYILAKTLVAVVTTRGAC